MLCFLVAILDTRIGGSGVREWNLGNGCVERMDEIMELTKK